MDIPQQQKQEVKIIIWGCHAFSKQLNQFFDNTAIQVILFIDDNDLSISTFCNKPVLRPDEFKKKYLDDIPIVVAIDRPLFFGRFVPRSKYIHQFKGKIQEINYQHQIQNQLLHPSALVDFLPLRFQFKPIFFGLQGAGNVIFNQIGLAICKLFLPLMITREKRTLFFEILCREYLHIIQQVVLDHIHFHDGHTVHHIAWKIGTSHFNYLFGRNNVPVSIYTFSTRDHIASMTSIYHQIPSLDYLNKLHAMQFTLFFIMRNPLDIILSGLNKLNGINKKSGEIDMHHFCGIAGWVINQLNAWHALTQHLHVLHYEDLLHSPVTTIKAIMKKLHIWPSTFVAKKIWKRFGYKQLPNAFKNHFWKGGSGKWEAFFQPKHLLILKNYGIEQVLMKYGYKKTCDRLDELISSSPSQDSIDRIHINSPHQGFYQDEHYDTYQFLIEQHGQHRCVKTGLLYLVCDHAETLAHFSAVFNNAYFTQIVNAGAHQAYRLC